MSGIPATPLTDRRSAPGAWTAGPEQPRLETDELHVWRAELAYVDDGLYDLLDSAERERAQRFASQRDRALWQRSRGLLRLLLGRYLGDDPAALALTISPGGKPILAQTPNGPDRNTASDERALLHFNLSHSGSLALFAFAHSTPVGVDIELHDDEQRQRRRRNHVGITRRIGGEREAARLARLRPSERERELLRLWTRHEAGLKCSGRGIGTGATRGTECSWVTELAVGGRAVAAVAAARAPGILRLWSFT